MHGNNKMLKSKILSYKTKGNIKHNASSSKIHKNFTMLLKFQDIPWLVAGLTTAYRLQGTNFRHFGLKSYKTFTRRAFYKVQKRCTNFNVFESFV